MNINEVRAPGWLLCEYNSESMLAMNATFVAVKHLHALLQIYKISEL